MFAKLSFLQVVLFFKCFVLSESVNFDNEIQIIELVEKMVAEKTSDLSRKVLSLENIVVNQQSRIDRLEKEDKRKERIIMSLLTTQTEIQKEVHEKNVGDTMDDVSTNSSNLDDHIVGKVLTGLNKSNGSDNGVSTVRPVKYITKSRRRRQTEDVAFTVYLSHNIDHMSVGHHIVFDKVITNDGAGYNVHTGIFTVPVTGLYLFTFSFNDHYRISVVQLVVDGSNIVDIVASPASNIESMSSNTAIIHVNQGQSVWLQDYVTQDGSAFSSESWRYCTFSGVRLY